MNHPIILTAALSLAASAVTAETFAADVWADNWFDMRINGTLVAEDSVPITTERSFNAESFTFDAERPFVVAITAKDFKENNTGLEYIGTRRQQMGDGGVIIQITSGSGETVAVTNSDWRCLVAHKAPLDAACEKSANPVAGAGACGFELTDSPEGWDQPGFDASNWPKAAVFSERDVRPKGGYDRITWDKTAELIWGPDLEKDNTILCRLEVE